MTRAVIWSGPEAPKAVLCKCCGDPAAHRALSFIRKKAAHNGSDLCNPGWAMAQLRSDSEGKLLPALPLPESWEKALV